MSFWTHSLHL